MMQHHGQSIVERLGNGVGFLLWLAGFVWLVTTPIENIPHWLGFPAAYGLFVLAAILFWGVVPLAKGFRTGDFLGAFLDALRSFVLALILGAVIWFILRTIL